MLSHELKSMSGDCYVAVEEEGEDWADLELGLLLEHVMSLPRDHSK